MPSTPSPLLRAELQALGENLSTWGDTRLNEALKRLEEGIAQVFTKVVTGNYTLASSNYVQDEARSAVLVLTGTPGATHKITIPSVTKTYLVANSTNASQTIGTAGGAAATVRAGLITLVYCDGTDTFAADPTLDKIKAAAANVSLNSKKITDLADATADQDAATKKQVDAVRAYAAGIANKGVLANGSTVGRFLKWYGDPDLGGAGWAESDIPALINGAGTIVSGSFTDGDMAVDVDTGTGANKIPSRNASGHIANLVGVWAVKTGAYNAASGDQIIADSSGGGFTVTLPASPATDDQIVVARIGASDVTIGRNGSTISGAAENLTLDSNYALVTLVCTGTNAWRAIPGQFR